MELKSSVSCSQKLATCPNPASNQSSPQPVILFISRPVLILSSHLRLGLPSGLFPQGFLTKILCTRKRLLSPMRAACSTHLILLDLISTVVLGMFKSLYS
jgi:hypothetical protein